MLVKQFSNIVQRFCMSEINKVIGKYSRISNDDVNIVERLIKKINNEELIEITSKIKRYQLYERYSQSFYIKVS